MNKLQEHHIYFFSTALCSIVFLMLLTTAFYINKNIALELLPYITIPIIIVLTIQFFKTIKLLGR